MVAATARAFSAQRRALSTRVAKGTGGVWGIVGGRCCAREMERLFTAVLGKSADKGLVGRDVEERWGGGGWDYLLRTTAWQLVLGIRPTAWR